MSVLDQWQDRWEFAAYNHEQRFQTALVTKRRLFNAILNYPLTQIQNELLRPDLVERDPVTKKPIRKIEFDAAAWRFIDDVAIGAFGGQFVRSFLFAYGNNKEFRDVHNASRALEGFGMAAEAHDTSPISLSDEIKAGRKGVVYDLVNHSAEASDLLDQFMHGRLDISPSNVSKLQRHLESMSRLCEERAALKEQYNTLRDPEALRREQEIVGKGNEKASGYIRDVMHLEKIESPRQAQVLSGFIAALMVDAAKPLGTEMYVPQEENFLPPEDAVRLSQFVSQQMEHRGFVPNISLKGGQPRPFPDLPEGVMVRALRDERTGEIVDYGKLTEMESLSFANALHGFVKRELGGKVENMLRYVDKNFDAIENSISRSQEDPIPEPIPIWKTGEPHTKPPVEERIKKAWEKGRNLNPFKMLEDVKRVASTAAHHVTRPEARYENNKLFGRAIAGQVVAYPVKVADEILKNFLRDSGGDYGKDASGKLIKQRRGGYNRHGWEVPIQGLDALIKATKNGKLEGELFDREGFKNNLKSTTFRLVTSPIAASFGTVLLQETYHLPKGLAVEASGRANKVLAAAMKAGHRHAPQVAERMQAMRDEHPSLRALVESDRYKHALSAIAAKKPEERSEEDYKLLAGYYQELSEICLSVAEEALSPYGVEVKPEKIESMDEVITRLLRQPVENVPDAMMALAYVQTFIGISQEKTASVEYVSPEQLLINHKELRALGDFIDNQAKAAGLVIAKEDADGFKEGELLERDKETGELRPAGEESLVRLANVVTQELKKHVDMDNLLYAVKGKYKEDYLGKIEHSVFGSTHFDLGDAKKEREEEEHDGEQKERQAPEELTKPWDKKVNRPVNGVLGNIKQNLGHSEVKHEMKKLLLRGLGESVSAFLPGLVYNQMQHDEKKLFSRAGIVSAFYKSAIYPLVYSYGVVAGKEAMNEVLHKRRHTINESNVAQSVIEGALVTAGRADPKLREAMIEGHKINADLLYVQTRDEFKDIPRITAKPRDFRTESDHELMQGFCDAIGEKLIGNSLSIFSALGKGEKGEAIEDVVERALMQPVENLGDAAITLGFMHAMLEQNAHNIDVLTFVRPEDKILNRDQLRMMVEYMNDQAANAGFALHGVPVQGKNGNSFTVMGQGDDTLKEGELLQWSDANQRYERAAPEQIIRYANVMVARFRTLAQDKLKDDGAEKLAEKYKISTKKRIFEHLRTPSGKTKEILSRKAAEGGFADMVTGDGPLHHAWVSEKKFSPQEDINREAEELFKANGIGEGEHDSHRARIMIGSAASSPTTTPSR